MEMKNPRLPLHVRTNLLLSPITNYRYSHFFPLSAMESEVPLSLGNPMVFQQNFFLSTERDFTDPLPQICCFPHLCGWLHKYRSFWHPRPRSVITAIKRRMLFHFPAYAKVCYASFISQSLPSLRSFQRNQKAQAHENEIQELQSAAEKVNFSTNLIRIM